MLIHPATVQDLAARLSDGTFAKARRLAWEGLRSDFPSFDSFARQLDEQLRASGRMPVAPFSPVAASEVRLKIVAILDDIRDKLNSDDDLSEHERRDLFAESVVWQSLYDTVLRSRK
jgi:hypothetical protein